MPKPPRRPSSFPSSPLQAIPEFSDQAHQQSQSQSQSQNQSQSHELELQDLAFPKKPDSTHQASNYSSLQRSKSQRHRRDEVEDGDEEAHPSEEVADYDRDNDDVTTISGGSANVGFSLARWWTGNIAREVLVQDDVRDHFALERTFLAYIRTSNALASISVAIYQLSRLSSPSTSTSLQPFTSTPSARVLTIEKAVTIIMIASALLVTVVGCGRFLVSQHKVEHGRWRVGGAELWGVGWGFVLVSSV